MSQKEFKARIRKAIANESLQIALDNNARRRKEARESIFAQMPDHEERRQRAHAIKADIIARLDEHLTRFIEKVSTNGITVHRAKDAEEAVSIFLQIAAKVEKKVGKPLLVAKSKSMISEEVNLNLALEKNGIKAVETDLGEYIVQLRGEHPSHIITPAVHLRRNDVGKLFEEKLGLPYTEDIPTLTNTARKVLRDVFLQADIGFSGVNFGVVETGTLCMVTNEGNGRMVTTLPKVHIAFMGIERMIPSMDDLALFLSLLPRSATGQKLSVYTSLINAPLPGQQRHLILLDNGRNALRNSPLAESLYCIRCGACLNVCPVFRELSGHAYGSIYPGPIGSVISCALVDPELACLAQASSLCGACREACPIDIDLPGMLSRIRAGGVPGEVEQKKEGRGLPGVVKLGLSGFRLAAANGSLFGFFQILGGLATHILSPKRSYMPLPAFTGWGFSKDFPQLAVRPFRAKWKDIHQDVEEKQVEGLKAADAPAKPEAPRLSLVEQFIQEATTLGVKVYPVTERNVKQEIASLLAGRKVECILSDDAGAEYVTDIAVVRQPDPGIQWGITGVVGAIAETGSLLLASGAGETLTASLLPEMHIAVLKASHVVARVESAMALPGLNSASSVIATGPSRTADIEMALTIGVHGPGEVHVFLIDDL
jgi:L-lactate dehydrogenase complex protein LldF